MSSSELDVRVLTGELFCTTNTSVCSIVDPADQKCYRILPVSNDHICKLRREEEEEERREGG